ncbi:MAG: MFS transporter [Myxococcales bacterium]|nr:MFS transporter [Myxococcales bacterium]
MPSDRDRRAPALRPRSNWSLRVLLPTMLVLGVPILVLLLAGIGEVLRTAPSLHLSRIRSEGKIVEQAVSSLLRAGLPLAEISGFEKLADPVRASNPWLERIEILDRQGHEVFHSGGDHDRDVSNSELVQACLGEDGRDEDGTLPSDSHLLVGLPLSSRFEDLGCLVLQAPRSMIWETSKTSFRGVGLVAVAGLLLMALGLSLGHRWRPRQWNRLVVISFSVLYLGISGVVASSMVQIYSDVVLGKSDALAESLAQRLRAPGELGISFDDLEGIPEVLHDYRRANPDIGYVAVVEQDGRARFHTDPRRVGAPWASNAEDHYESSLDLHTGVDGDMVLVLSIPKEKVHAHIQRGFKNFIALFIASLIVSRMFLKLATGATRLEAARRLLETPAAAPGGGHSGAYGLSSVPFDLIMLLFALIVFLEALVLPFLPVFFRTVLADGSKSQATLLFTLYFAAFALVLIPTGRLVERRGARLAIMLATTLCGLSFLGLALATSFTGLAISRLVAGCGQGMAFIGVQSYLLAMGRRFGQSTRAASVIVVGYQSATISGTAIGALLESHVGPYPVFVMAAICGLVATLFCRRLVVDLPPAAAHRRPRVGLRGGLRTVVRDLQFMGTTLLVGLPTKALLSGVIAFTWPLLLYKRFEAEDVGQILMFYAGGVLLCNHLLPALDRRGVGSRALLVTGLVGSVGALAFMGQADDVGAWLGERIGTWSPMAMSHWLPFVLTAIATFSLGLAQGLIHAPVLAHIASTPTSTTLGPASATSIYRSLERLGPVIGPLALGAGMSVLGESPVVLSWTAAVVGGLGLLFVALPHRRPPRVGAEGAPSDE